MLNGVPDFDRTKLLMTDDWKEVIPAAPSAVRMHTMQSVNWAWLQPYLVRKETKTMEKLGTEKEHGGKEELKTVFMPLAVIRSSLRCGWSLAPTWPSRATCRCAKGLSCGMRSRNRIKPKGTCYMGSLVVYIYTYYGRTSSI